MTNPYYVEPAGQALSGLGSAIAGKMIQKREAEEKEALQMKNKALVGEAQGLLDGNDIGALQDFMLANPAMGKRIDSMMNFKDDRTRANATETGFKIMSGSDPKAAIMERAEFISQNGGDPTQTLQMLEATPEGQANWAKFLLAQNASKDQLSALKDMSSQTAKYQMGAGGMSGYTFNPENGQFTINEDVKLSLANKAREKLMNKSKLTMKDKQGVNKDVTSLIKDSVGVYNTANDLQELGALGGGPASIALIFKFMKALDPQSVVRESEFATAENSSGVPEGIRNLYNKVMEGEKLGDEQIAQFISTANALADSSTSASRKEVSSYLNAYGDSMPDDFKAGLSERIPALIGVKTGGDSEIDRSKYSNSALKYIDEAAGK